MPNSQAFRPGACIIKLIAAIIYGFEKKDRVFVPGKPFQPSLMFARNKYSSLSRKSVNYDRNKFYDTGSRLETLNGRKTLAYC